MNEVLRRALGIGQAPAASLSDKVRASDNTAGGFRIVTGLRTLGTFPANPDASSPESVTAMSVSTRSAYQAIQLILQLDAAELALTEDANLSPVGRKAKREPQLRDGARSLAAIAAEVRKYAKEVEAAAAARYDVPQISDVRAEMRDKEIRDIVRALPPEQLKDLSEPRLLAILRSPDSFGHLESLARQLWVDMIDRRDPAGREAIRTQQAAVEWAQSVINTIAAVLLPSFTEASGSRENLWLLTRQHEPEKLWNMSSAEVSAFKFRVFGSAAA